MRRQELYRTISRYSVMSLNNFTVEVKVTEKVCYKLNLQCVSKTTIHASNFCNNLDQKPAADFCKFWCAKLTNGLRA